MKKISNILILLIVSLCACTDPYADSAFTGAAETLPAATYMKSHAEEMKTSLWVQLLEYTDLYNTINLNANYTCFVPVDEAMQQYLAEKKVSSVTDLKMDEAKLLVKYHTIQGNKYNSTDFVDGVLADTTATGDFLACGYADAACYINDRGRVIETIQTTNAYIHTLNAVLIPITETIWDKMQANSFSILKSAIEATDYATKLGTITTEELEDGNTVYRKYKYTLFAVTDEVFKKADITNLESLVRYLGAGNDYKNADNLLNKFVAYHLLNQQYSYLELSTFSKVDNVSVPRNVNTMASNEIINLSEVQNTLYINKTEEGGVQLVKKNDNCKNGVIHTVDNLMIVAAPAATKVQWELTDYPQLTSISDYRIKTLSTAKSYFGDEISWTCYKWSSTSTSFGGVLYHIAGKNDTEKNKAVNHDYLQLRLGMYGWMEFVSPALVKGKYRVIVEHFNPQGDEKEGKLSFIFDGKYVGGEISTTGDQKTKAQFKKVTLGEVEFTETATHTVRILAGDNTMSYLDCITFEPIK